MHDFVHPAGPLVGSSYSNTCQQGVSYLVLFCICISCWFFA